jgi:hypothetical protein
MDIANTAVVAVRPAPRLVEGHLSAADIAAVSDWIRLNQSTLIDYWDFQIDTDEFLEQPTKFELVIETLPEIANRVF